MSGSRERGAVIALAMALAAPLAATGCPATPGVPPGHASNVVLVTLDTVRADHLGCYGYGRDTTPFLDGLAARGVRFTAAFTQSPHTAPSHASMLTSLFPEQHRVVVNGTRLDPRTATLATNLRAAGFATAAFPSAGFLKHLAVGFDVIDHTNTPGFPYRRADETVDAAIRWLAGGAAETPFLLWIHLYDAHEHAREDQARPADLARIRALPEPGVAETRAAIVAAHRLDPTVVARHFDVYDAQLRFQDAELARLFAALQRYGLDRETLWVVTADHGEGMGNHANWGHGSLLYDEQLRVPLIVYGADRREPATLEALVQHVDLLPTILALVGAPAPPAADRIEGRSWAALLDDPANPTKADPARPRPHPVWAQTPPFAPFQRGAASAGDTFAARTATHKYIFHTKQRNELYDLRSDPGETRNRVATPGRAGRRLGRWAVREYDRTRRDRRSDTTLPTLSEEEREQLRQLGYL